MPPVTPAPGASGASPHMEKDNGHFRLHPDRS
nr:MAG TPA: hypothetical protein [Caudoviricetes sp.]